MPKYKVLVHWIGVLPAASFRFHLTMDTLAVQLSAWRYLLPSGLSPFRTCACAAHWQQYKAGGYVVAVPAAYTSCECPSCTCTDKRNRPRQAQFRCIGCGYENNADIVGAINVRRKGRTGPSAHDQKRIAREVSAGAVVPFARNSGANSENQPLGGA